MLVPARILQGWTSLLSSSHGSSPGCSKRNVSRQTTADLCSRGRRGEGAKGPGGLWRSD